MTRRILVAFLFSGKHPGDPGKVLLHRVTRPGGVALYSGFTAEYPVGSGKPAATVLAEAYRNAHGIFVPGNTWELVADVWATGLRADVFRVFSPTSYTHNQNPERAAWEPPGLWVDPTNARVAAAVLTLPLMLSLCLTAGYFYPVVITKPDPNHARSRNRRSREHAGQPAAAQLPGTGEDDPAGGG